MSASIFIEYATLAKTTDSSTITPKRKTVTVVVIIDKNEKTDHLNHDHNKLIPQPT